MSSYEGKFTQENAEEIMRRINTIIEQKKFCNNDDFIAIIKGVFELAQSNGIVMESIKKGQDGHYKLDLEEELKKNGIRIAIVPRNGKEKYHGNFCYFVRNGETPECSGRPIPYTYSLDYLGYYSTTVNFVAFSSGF